MLERKKGVDCPNCGTATVGTVVSTGEGYNPVRRAWEHWFEYTAECKGCAQPFEGTRVYPGLPKQDEPDEED